jgi:hypothetical protein
MVEATWTPSSVHAGDAAKRRRGPRLHRVLVATPGWLLVGGARIVLCALTVLLAAERGARVARLWLRRVATWRVWGARRNPHTPRLPQT